MLIHRLGWISRKRDNVIYRCFRGFLISVWESSIGNSMDLFSNMGAFHGGYRQNMEWPNAHIGMTTNAHIGIKTNAHIGMTFNAPIEMMSKVPENLLS